MASAFMVLFTTRVVAVQTHHIDIWNQTAGNAQLHTLVIIFLGNLLLTRTISSRGGSKYCSEYIGQVESPYRGNAPSLQFFRSCFTDKVMATYVNNIVICRPLLGNDREIINYTTAVARSRFLNNCRC
jgi:hypothetical protein